MPTAGWNRRDFVKTSAVLSAAALTGPLAGAYGRAGRSADRLRIGVIGCGGRGTGAAANALEAGSDVEIFALGDVFPERVASCRKNLSQIDEAYRDRITVNDDRCFTGFDAYRHVISSGVDMVILATPPHFRPMHIAAAIAAGKHVFAEKPVAVDPIGVRLVLKAADEADARGLRFVAGTQRRHQRSYLEGVARIHEGAIGRITGGSCYWNQGGLWVVDRKPEWTDMQWQTRNWLYFTWLSGDHIVEQHVHNLDVMNWAIGSPPVSCVGMGGRQVRTDPKYGHIFDHFAVEYTYPGGIVVNSYCRQMPGCADRVAEVIRGTSGTMNLWPGHARAEGASPWQFGAGDPNPYVQEHRALQEAVFNRLPLNEGRAVAESTLTAIMGRMSAYTGKQVTWDFALNHSTLHLAPENYDWNAAPPPDEIAVPGRTPLT
ncbi:MAG: Gfo/Idh/MocA family oxidoreductase [Phycisphaeraceae bacterium]|nr:Gfo/Idh/MocA family oxidoreductase [Phycisphaeraceae bacterium]